MRLSQMNTEPAYATLGPSLCLVAQGAKALMLGNEVFEYDPARMLVFAVDLPVSGQVTRASRREPFLGFRLDLDPARVAELAARVFPRGVPKPSDNRGLFVGRATDDIIDAVTRLLTLMARPEDADLLGPLVVDEILIRLLRTPIGTRVAQIGEPKSGVHRMGEAISWIRAHFTQPVTVDEMAASVRMSASSFHERFKAVTSMSPLQYQKVLRLHEARRLMLFQDMDASDACRRVGYLSPSQFSREYARFFGSAPDEGHGTPPGGGARPAPAPADSGPRLSAVASTVLPIALWISGFTPIRPEAWAIGESTRPVPMPYARRTGRQSHGGFEGDQTSRVLAGRTGGRDECWRRGACASAGSREGGYRRAARRGRRRSRLLQGHPLRGASCRRPAVAAAAAGGAVDGRAPGRGIRGELHAGTIRRAASGRGCAPRRACAGTCRAPPSSKTACS